MQFAVFFEDRMSREITRTCLKEARVQGFGNGNDIDTKKEEKVSFVEINLSSYYKPWNLKRKALKK